MVCGRAKSIPEDCCRQDSRPRGAARQSVRPRPVTVHRARSGRVLRRRPAAAARAARARPAQSDHAPCVRLRLPRARPSCLPRVLGPSCSASAAALRPRGRRRRRAPTPSVGGRCGPSPEVVRRLRPARLAVRRRPPRRRPARRASASRCAPRCRARSRSPAGSPVAASWSSTTARPARPTSRSPPTSRSGGLGRRRRPDRHRSSSRGSHCFPARLPALGLDRGRRPTSTRCAWSAPARCGCCRCGADLPAAGPPGSPGRVLADAGAAGPGGAARRRVRPAGAPAGRPGAAGRW